MTLEVPDLDGDEVGLALVGYGLGQQGLTTARWAIEENTLGRGHPKLEELLWELNRVLGGREGGEGRGGEGRRGEEQGITPHQYSIIM